MKKTIVFISSVIVIISVFAACSDKTSVDKNKSEKNTEATSASTTYKTAFDYNSDYELGDEVATTVIENGSERQILHRDEYGDFIKMDHCDSEGNVIYYEEPIYSSNGDVRGYNFYDINDNHFGSTDSENRFYNVNGVEISENDFVALLEKAKNTKKSK